MSDTVNAMYIEQPEYRNAFMEVMRGKEYCADKLTRGRSMDTGTYVMPSSMSDQYANAIVKESLFRRLATVVNAYHSSYRILARDCDDLSQFVPEGGAIPFQDAAQDFTTYTVDTHKLAVLLKLDEDFVHDAAFDMDRYLIGRLAKNFGRAETKAFISGTGTDMPTGILHGTKGAEVGCSCAALTYDDVIHLYFSVNPEYRAAGVWLMNDETALALRTLKDSAGNYLWRDRDDTILGKKVMISEFMPGASSGSKPIAFGDFGYYWVVCKKPVTVRALKEKFVTLGQIGYLAFEFLDGKLIRPDAVKVLQMTEGAPA